MKKNKKTPPHLPPAYSSLKNHKLWQRLKIIISVAFFSLLASIAGSSILLGWIWPNLNSSDIWITSYQRSNIQTELNDRVKKEMSERIVTVYSGENKIGEMSYLEEKNKIADAVIISSDGWLVMSKPDYLVNSNKLIILTADGNVYTTDKVIKDPYTNLIYAKISAGQFRVINFSTEINDQDEVFVFENNVWQSTKIKQKTFYQINEESLDTAPRKVFNLENNFSDNKVVINNQGRMIGFVLKNNQVLPAVYITRILDNFLNNKIIEYKSLGVDGWYTQQKPTIVNKQLTNGFVVSKVWSTNSSELRTGDLITNINSLVVNEENLWYIINNNNEINLTILRAGKKLELKINISTKIIKN